MWIILCDVVFSLFLCADDLIWVYTYPCLCLDINLLQILRMKTKTSFCDHLPRFPDKCGINVILLAANFKCQGYRIWLGNWMSGNSFFLLGLSCGSSSQVLKWALVICLFLPIWTFWGCTALIHHCFVPEIMAYCYHKSPRLILLRLDALKTSVQTIQFPSENWSVWKGYKRKEIDTWLSHAWIGHPIYEIFKCILLCLL